MIQLRPHLPPHVNTRMLVAWAGNRALYAAPNIKSTAHHVAVTSVFQRGEWARGSVSQFEISAAPKCRLNRWERRRIQKTSYSGRGNPSAWRILAPTAGIASLL